MPFLHRRRTLFQLAANHSCTAYTNNPAVTSAEEAHDWLLHTSLAWAEYGVHGYATISMCNPRVKSGEGADGFLHRRWWMAEFSSSRRMRRLMLWIFRRSHPTSPQEAVGYLSDEPTMDPVSVAASVLTVLGAAATAARALDHLSSLKHAPDSLIALVNEVRVITGRV